MRYGVVLLVLVGCWVATLPVLAQPSATDRSLAQSLFDQAKALMTAGNYAEACPKLAESQRLDPGGGTLLNLALCHEKEGKIATAWTDFKLALTVAHREGRAERVQAAEEHIAALEPELPWLTIVVANPAADQLVALDGGTMGRAAWGTPVAVDPGQHQVQASAPGHEAWSQAVTIGPGEKKSVTVPALEAQEPASTAPVRATPGQDRAPEDGDSKTVAWIIGGAGVAALGVGSFFGVQTLSKKSQSDDLCPTDTTCRENGAELNEEAHTSAWITNISVGIGVIGVGIATYMLLSGGDGPTERGAAVRDTSTAVSVRADLHPQGGQVSFGGTW